MPIGFLTDAERAQLNRFPDEIPHDDLSAFFTLTDGDIQEIDRQRGDPNRLGFALQLCALRYLGFAPDELGTAPAPAIHFVAHQLGLTPEALQTYGHRLHTRTDHLRRAQAHLGFRKAAPADLNALAQWLLQRALEHDKPTLLLALACEQLRREHIVRPGITRLEQLVATARHQAQEETYRRLLPLLTPSRRSWLDALLQPEASIGSRTPLTWLRGTATAATAPQIRTTLEKIEFLQHTGVADWDLSLLNPNRIKFLAQIGRKATNQSLQRTPIRRRYPILIAFLKQALLMLTDEVVEMFDQCLWDCHTDAKKDLEEFQQRMASATNEKLRLFRNLGQVLLDPSVEDVAVRAVSFQRVPADLLRTALEETDRLIRPRSDAYVDYFGNRYRLCAAVRTDLPTAPYVPLKPWRRGVTQSDRLITCVGCQQIPPAGACQCTAELCTGRLARLCDRWSGHDQPSLLRTLHAVDAAPGATCRQYLGRAQPSLCRSGNLLDSS
jgi:hypothetical protein